MNIPTYPPLNTLKAVANNIWIVDGDIIHMSVPFIQVPFSTRMTVVRLNNGDMWLHSPIAFDADLADEILALGPIKHLVSPNAIHYAYIAEWKQHFPDALAWSSPGVEKRAQSQNIEINFDQALEDTPPKEWENDIKQLIFKGGRVIQEVIFYHIESRTLILTDLIENFEPDKTKSTLWKTVHKIAKISAPNGTTPIDYRMSFIGNKKAAKESLEKIISWQPKRIIIAHGKWIEDNGVEELRKRMSWILK
ncbi:DUF4336 domain-containing protein [Fundicoccus culcitae]|uniref:DUF4336 domain-containing protein n=1 Tax=Fundicoccus culcitae TaxID=2969821 RepID=A0ABY5P8B8_9LACT|nr:DUF4336 domain-containing protein [Fundicoccus culcitae]UUX34715.1 DUF4336 domain-containing protein [Fundicoccus culcitae]